MFGFTGKKHPVGYKRSCFGNGSINAAKAEFLRRDVDRDNFLTIEGYGNGRASRAFMDVATTSFADTIRDVFQPNEDTRALDAAIFRIYDRDGDGKLSFEEFSPVFDLTVFEIVFAIFSDSDGRMDADNYTRALRSVYRRVAPEDGFTSYDTNNSGFLDKREFMRNFVGGDNSPQVKDIVFLEDFLDQVKSSTGSTRTRL